MVTKNGAGSVDGNANHQKAYAGNRRSSSIDSIVLGDNFYYSPRGRNPLSAYIVPEGIVSPANHILMIVFSTHFPTSHRLYIYWISHFKYVY